MTFRAVRRSGVSPIRRIPYPWMADEPRRSGFVTWLLIGLVVLLVLGTAGAVTLPILRCPACRMVQRNENEAPVKRVRLDGKWRTTTDACPCCVDRKKVTAV